MKKKIKVMAPASVANVSCGFDIMGFALSDLGDQVTVTLHERKKGNGQVLLSGKYATMIPGEPDKNTASIAVKEYLRFLKLEEVNYTIELEKNLPLGSGLGSSASSAVAAVVAINMLLGEPLSRKALLPFAMEGERVVCGAAHADNAAPSLLGGFTLIRSYQPLDVISIPCPENLFAVVAHPDVELKTADARRIIKQEISISEAVSQSANTAGFIAGLLTNDLGLISRSMKDILAEPKRKLLIPGFHEAKLRAMDAGALGFGISGSGPAVFALCNGVKQMAKIDEALKECFSDLNLGVEIFRSTLNAPGAMAL